MLLYAQTRMIPTNSPAFRARSDPRGTDKRRSPRKPPDMVADEIATRVAMRPTATGCSLSNGRDGEKTPV